MLKTILYKMLYHRKYCTRCCTKYCCKFFAKLSGNYWDNSAQNFVEKYCTNFHIKHCTQFCGKCCKKVSKKMLWTILSQILQRLMEHDTWSPPSFESAMTFRLENHSTKKIYGGHFDRIKAKDQLENFDLWLRMNKGTMNNWSKEREFEVCLTAVTFHSIRC